MINGFKELEEAVKSVLPPACELARVELEGPQVVIYIKNMQAFYADENLITRIAGKLRKKVIVRTDASVLAPVEKALAKIKSLIPVEAGVKDIRFDPVFHEVVIETNKPGLVIGKQGSVLKSIMLATGWSPRVLRAATMPSETEAAIRNSLLAMSEQRKKFLSGLGKKLSAGGKACEWVKITALGGFREVGRSCFLLQTPNSNVLIDCGINIDTSDSARAYPYLNAMGLSLDQIDAVILSHAHLDHCMHPDSLIQFADGEIRRIEDAGPSPGVLSFDFVSGEASPAAATKGITQKPEMLRLTTNLFNSRATPEHRFFVVEGLEIKERRAGELREGDFVASIASSNFEGRPQPLPQVSVLEHVALSEKALRLVREKRVSLGLLKKDVASRAGIPAYRYVYLESGKHKPSLSDFDKVVAVLGLNKGEFDGQATLVSTATLPSQSSPDFCQFLGYVLGDGNPHFPYPKIVQNDLAVTDKDVANLEFYAGLAEKVFYTKPRWSLKASAGGRNRVFFSSNVTRLLFAIDEKILSRSRQRRIPALVHKVSNGELAAFFRGLYDAEGSVGHHSALLISTSEMLVRVAQMLLLRFGIWSSIEDRKSTFKQFTKGPAYALKITHPASLKKFAESIGFSSVAKSQKLAALVAKIGKGVGEKVDLIPINGMVLRDKLREAGLHEGHFGSRISRYWLASHHPSRASVHKIIATLDALAEGSGPAALAQQASSAGSSTLALTESRVFQLARIKSLAAQLKQLSAEGILWARIRKISPEKPPEKVYDLTVPGFENFIADGFVVHNSGFNPYLYAYGYEGPTYVTPPTRDLMVLLQQDCVNVMNSEGGKAPYGERDIKKQLAHVITREYGEVTDVTNDIRFTFHNAGHMLGSAMVHLHIGEGLHNLVYSADLKYGRTKLCDAASTNFPRVETLLIESTYGGRNDIKPRLEEGEMKLAQVVSEVTARRGKVLIPVIASGRAQEIMLVLEEKFKDPGFPVYVDGMCKESSAIHTVYPEYLRRNVQRRILQNDSPFDKPMFRNVQTNDQRKAIAEGDEPCVILAPSGMLTGGPSVEYLKMMADDSRNALVFVGYQASLTLGRKIQSGEREVPVLNSANKQETLKVNFGVHTLDGFSGHSDRAQLLAWARNLRPKPTRVMTLHGEEGKCEELARTLNHMLHVQSQVPMNLDSIRLK